MNEQQERQNSLTKAIIALAYAPAIFVAPAIVIFFIFYFGNLDVTSESPLQGIFYLAVILMFCGVLFAGISAFYALTIFFRIPRLKFTRPVPQRSFWAFVAIASTIVNLLGLISKGFQSKYFSHFMGIDVFSNTLIFASLGFYLFALFKVIKEKPKTSAKLVT